MPGKDEKEVVPGFTREEKKNGEKGA